MLEIQPWQAASRAIVVAPMVLLRTEGPQQRVLVSGDGMPLQLETQAVVATQADERQLGQDSPT